MAKKGPADQDGAEALRRLLSGLARGDDVFHLAAAIEELHPPHNTFPERCACACPPTRWRWPAPGRTIPSLTRDCARNTWAGERPRAGRTARATSAPWPVRQPARLQPARSRCM